MHSLQFTRVHVHTGSSMYVNVLYIVLKCLDIRVHTCTWGTALICDINCCIILQHVRELSRQQFMARATIMKARTTAGLPQHGVPAW